ncbi:transposase [Anopheles sinensis]|uniref:Transposase n=1 Tax=Anopheles sinensis TaxID=74873 RepID=A0A084WNJ1_ANOSI|nr:transposase [Anopheles sinensis]
MATTRDIAPRSGRQKRPAHRLTSDRCALQKRAPDRGSGRTAQEEEEDDRRCQAMTECKPFSKAHGLELPEWSAGQLRKDWHTVFTRPVSTGAHTPRHFTKASGVNLLSPDDTACGNGRSQWRLVVPAVTTFSCR